MKILFPERIEEFSRKHADAKEALSVGAVNWPTAEWKSHADAKADFPSADFVGNNRYVFNVKDSNYRTVVLVVFFARQWLLGLSVRMVSMTRLRILKIYRLWLSGTKKSTKITKPAWKN